MKLVEKQWLFSSLLAKLILWAYAQGYAITIKEVLRTSAQATANAVSGKGISNSLHLLSLAADLALFIEGVYQTDSAAYRKLGEYWKSLHPLCRWGGDFSKPDGNHFSLEHNGVR
jgi:hypothetical protein